MMCVDKAVFLYLFVFIAICAEAHIPELNVTAKDPVFGLRGNASAGPKGLIGSIDQDVVKPQDSFFGFGGNVNARPKEQDVVRPQDSFFGFGGNVNARPKGQDVVRPQESIIDDGTPVDVLTETSTPVLIDGRLKPSSADCLISKTKVQGLSNICKDEMIFNEDFNETNLKELKQWDAMIQFPTEPDYPFNVYIPDNTVSFEEGSFVITPVLTLSQRAEGFLHKSLDLGDRCTGKASTAECKQEASGAQILPPVTTAKITTRRSFNFMFGRVEVRAKLPSGSWIIPEINLEPSENEYGPQNYESGLMRIAFVRGNPGLAKKLYGGPVLTNSEPFRSLLMQEKIGIDNWHKDFHNYTMIWRPDGIDFLVDGEQYGTVKPGGGFSEIAKKNNVDHASQWQRGTIMAPLDQMFHLTLGLRVGGVNDFADDLEDKPWKNKASKAMLNFWKNKDSWHPSWGNGGLRVDYVRVYAL